jgi:hypothetical protein
LATPKAAPTTDSGLPVSALPNFRQQQIVEIARSAGQVMVDDLAARFEVTPQTIRKDLNELCDQRLLSRVHGGAIIASGAPLMPSDGWIEDHLSMVLQSRQRAGFVGSHHAGITDDISRENGGQASIGLIFGHSQTRIGDSSAAPAAGNRAGRHAMSHLGSICEDPEGSGYVRLLADAGSAERLGSTGDAP